MHQIQAASILYRLLRRHDGQTLTTSLHQDWRYHIDVIRAIDGFALWVYRAALLDNLSLASTDRATIDRWRSLPVNPALLVCNEVWQRCRSSAQIFWPPPSTHRAAQSVDDANERSSNSPERSIDSNNTAVNMLECQ